MSSVVIAGVGVVALGLPDWATAQAVLSGVQPYRADPLPEFPRALLPANERRRTSRTVKLVLQTAASPALNGAHAAALATVFASSSGDGDIIDKLCRVLATPERLVSPTDFHNSVHNAPAGYWSLASANRQTSLSLSAHDGGFAAGLIEACALAQAERIPVLLVAYDYPSPEPLWAARPLSAPFAVALLVAPEGIEGYSKCQVKLAQASTPTQLDDPELERLRNGNPAARSLPLLRQLARRAPGAVVLPYLADTALQATLMF